MPSSAMPQVADTAGASEPRQAIDRPGLIVSISAIAALLMGTLAFSGWLLGWPLFKSVRPGAVDMKAHTALGLMAAGGALWLLGHRRAGFFKAAGLALARCVHLVAGLCSGPVLGIRLNVDFLS